MDDFKFAMEGSVPQLGGKKPAVVVDWKKGEAGYPARMLQLGVDELAERIKKDYVFTRNRMTLPPWITGLAEKVAEAGEN